MSELLTPKQVADLLQVQVETLEAWRGKRQGPEFVKLGPGKRAHVRYPKEAVEKFLQKEPA